MKKKVLVIDDSALMRRVLSDIINKDKLLTAGKAAENGKEALEMILQGEKFDILLVDINMPKMNGVQFLKELNKYRIHIPVLIVSSIASESANETIEALALGAFDFVKKPNGSVGYEMEDFRRQLLLRIYLACGLRVDSAEESKEEVRSHLPRKRIKRAKGHDRTLVVIASSTGGPRALQSVLPYFPMDFPYPVVVIQHMPAGFTDSLAKRLDVMSPLHVKEAEDGEIIQAGNVYIAQGGKQCELIERGKGTFVLSETDKPARGGLRPCADIFLESLPDTSLERCVCGVLTGMGADGCKGLQYAKQYKEIKVVAQNEETCVVYGMPRAVAKAGIVNEVVPLDEVANAMIKQLGV